MALLPAGRRAWARIELRARRRRRRVSALPSLHELPASSYPAVEPVYLRGAPVSGQRSGGDLLAVQRSGLRSPILALPRVHCRPQAVRRRVWRVPAGACARHALRRGAAQRPGVRVRDVLRGLVGVAADEHLRARPMAPAAGGQAGGAARPATCGRARGARRVDLFRRPSGDDLSCALRHRGLLPVSIVAPRARCARGSARAYPAGSGLRLRVDRGHRPRQRSW